MERDHTSARYCCNTMQLATGVCNKLARIAMKRRTGLVVDMKQHAKGPDEIGDDRGKGVQPAGERIAIYLRITRLRGQGDSVHPCVADVVASVNAGQMYGSTGQGMPACGHPRPRRAVRFSNVPQRSKGSLHRYKVCC